MNSLTIVMTLMGLGLGLIIGFVLGHGSGRREAFKLTERRWRPVDSEVYYGKDVAPSRWARDDEDDHPADIERQGSHLVPAPTAAVSKRSWDERYDGMDERRVLA